MFPPITWMPAPLGKFWIVLPLIEPAVIDAWFEAERLATTLIAEPTDSVRSVLLVRLFPVIVRFEIAPV